MLTEKEKTQDKLLKEGVLSAMEIVLKQSLLIKTLSEFHKYSSLAVFAVPLAMLFMAVDPGIIAITFSGLALGQYLAIRSIFSAKQRELIEPLARSAGIFSKLARNITDESPANRSDK